MKQIHVFLHDQVVEVDCPPSVMPDVQFLYRENIDSSGVPGSRILIREAEDGRFSVVSDDESPVVGLARDDLPTFVMEALVRGLVKNLATAVAIHAGAVAHNGRAVLIAGPTGAGKSSLVAWLIANGFTYLSDEIALLLGGQTEILGLPRALVLKPGSADQILAMPAYRGARTVTAGEHVMVRPVQSHEAKRHPCGLIVFPRYEVGSDLRVEAISPAQAALRLVGTNLNARNLADGGFRALTGLSRQVPAITVRYGSFGQLQGTADVLARILLDGRLDAAASRRFLSLFAPGRPPTEAVVAPTTAAPAPKKYEIPAPTPRREPRKLTIGMATYDDYDGVYFSLQAIRLYHPEILDQANFLVVDNHPDGPCAESLKTLEGSTPHYRYVPFNSHSGTAVRDFIFAEADGQFVLCMDCHVFIVPGALKRLMDYFAAHPETRDLLQGPLVFDDLATIATHFHPAWRSGMYGYWETDERGRDPDAPPFDIPMQGLGVFSCRRAAWPGFNPRFRGFGGEEGYIHEKFRRNGGRSLCLPFLRWMHRFSRPMGVPYTNRWEDRVRNYVIGFRELGLPTLGLEQHFQELLGNAAAPILQQIKQELDYAQ